MPTPKSGTYYADPFAINLGNKLHVYFEHYNYKDRKGVLSQLSFEAGIWSSSKLNVLDEEFHVSYPFLFVDEGVNYCVPESAEKNQVNLYAVDAENNKLKFVKTLLNDVRARDTSLIKYEGIWWMFCTLEDGPNSKLHLYHSPDILGPYVPHKNNAVKDDLSSARSGGTPFVANGSLYRPAQDCTESYGGKISINKVLKLNLEEFEETIEKTIEPITGSAYDMGIHTLSAAGEYTLIDGRTSTFIWSNFTFQLNRKIKKVLHLS